MVWKRRNSGAGGSPGRDDKEEKVPRGHVPMVAGGERVLVPVTLLGDPCVAELLDMAAQRYGYGQSGVLRVPCDAERFRQVVDGAMQRCGISSPA
jgi:hypothetical protein